jgi:AraC-like DNA-binding protein
MALLDRTGEDHRWSSTGLPPVEALRLWKHRACEAINPMHIEVPDETRFAAHLQNQAIGPLRLVTLEASPQKVVHSGGEQPRNVEASFHLLHFQRSTAPISACVGSQSFSIDVGEFVLIDASQSYSLSMEDDHRALILLMPGSWLEWRLPDPYQLIGRPIAAAKWGLPLASYMTAMADHLQEAPLSRSAIADQLGALIGLAIGNQSMTASRHKGKLAHRAMRLIEERFGDAELAPGDIATELGVSKRYLHALLAEAGATFLAVLGQVRLQRSTELLMNPRYRHEQISEIAWRCGYMDPSYFARVFRRRYGVGPREWRAARR